MSEFVARFAPVGFAPDRRFCSEAMANDDQSALAPNPDNAPDPLQQAWLDGHEAGLAQAAEAEAEAEALRARFAFAFERIDSELAEVLRQRLHATVIALCEDALRPLALDSDALARRVARAVAMLMRAEDERIILLNPDDLALVAARLPQEWTFRCDPALERGALRIETPGGGVEDGPEQWRRDVTEALRLC